MFTMAALSVLLLIFNVDVGFPFSLCCAAIAGTSMVLYRFEEWRGYSLLFLGALFVVYHFRIPVLYFYPESFVYHRNYALTPELLSASTYDILLPTFLILLGMALPILSGVRLKPRDGISQHRTSILVTHGHYIVVLAFIVFLVRFFLAWQYGVGVKMVENKAVKLMFLTRLIPEMTCVGLCTIMVVVYRKELARPIVVGAVGFLVCNAMASILFGSKAGLLMVAFACTTIFLSRFRDNRVSKRTILLVAVPAVLLIAFSFVAASTFRWATNKESSLKAGISAGMRKIELNSELKEGLLKASARSSAFDGVQISKIREPGLAVGRAFSPFNVAMNVVANLLPGVSHTGKSISAATAKYYFGREEGLGVTLGLIPNLRLMFPGFSPLAMIGFGFVCTWIYAASNNRIRDPDLSVMIQFFVVFGIVRLVMSGAFDQILAEIIAQMVHVIAIMYVLARLNVARQPVPRTA